MLREINGCDADGQPLSAYTELKDDGSTACGCWIYCGCYADGVNQAGTTQARHGADVGRGGVGVGVAREPPHPLQPRVGRSRRAAVVGAQALRRGGTTTSSEWTGPDVPDFDRRRGRRTTGRPTTRTRTDAIRGDEPFIMQADGKGWLFVPTGLVDGPLPDALRAAGVAVREPAVPRSSRTRRGRRSPRAATATTRDGDPTPTSSRTS